ncbi:MAG: adenylate/guanylate cyclase domain-containing protein [Ferruginibacter sp.]|nr:adenylate/guanylate cyclase domain-containing protein [Chitinophagaceae bacterium]
MTQRQQLKFTKLGIIIVAWLCIGFVITCYDYFVLTSGLSAGYSPSFTFGNHLAFNLLAALLGALMGGGFLVFYVNEKYRDKPYGFTVIAVLISFFTVIAIITVVLAFIGALVQTGKSYSDHETKKAFYGLLSNRLHVKNIVVWSVVVVLTQVMLQFNTKFGEGNMWNLVRGKYQTPREEQRIFMFVDLNSSTTIAEKLGDEKYHQLLKEFFADITNPILDNKGEIYQYVGDEVVIAWKYDDGIRYNRCIECFFAMKSAITQLSNKYLAKYELVPGFKAGIHCGRVVAGEVGIIKRDITFSGDVLNTTSRIQGKCKEFSAEIIASGELLNALQLAGKYTTRFLGSIKLRGKEKDVELSTLIPVSS